RADAFAELTHYSEAIEEWNRAIEVDTQPGHHLLRAHRALTSARSGNHIQAVAEADELMQPAIGNGEVLYVLARVYCVSAAVVGKDPKLAADQQRKLRERSLSAAYDLLNKAQQAGYFKTF